MPYAFGARRPCAGHHVGFCEIRFSAEAVVPAVFDVHSILKRDGIVGRSGVQEDDRAVNCEHSFRAGRLIFQRKDILNDAVNRSAVIEDIAFSVLLPCRPPGTYRGDDQGGFVVIQRNGADGAPALDRVQHRFGIGGGIGRRGRRVSFQIPSAVLRLLHVKQGHSERFVILSDRDGFLFVNI